jgi:hypothetical protein
MGVFLGLSELERLSEDFGWEDWNLDENGVRSKGTVDDGKISFPSDTWDEDSFNEVGLGVWAEMRFEHILGALGGCGVSTIWEVGAGNGAVTIGLKNAGLTVVAIEPLYSGAHHLVKNGIVSFSATLEDLSLPNASLPAIGLFDVLEHVERPETILATCRKKLSDSGILAVTVPAHQWLFSKYDLGIGHFRRYDSSTLKVELESSGFEIVSIRYLFSFLVPLAWLIRVLPEKLGIHPKKKSIEIGRKQISVADRFAPLFKFLSRAEQRLRLPIGLSLLCIARVKNQSSN